MGSGDKPRPAYVFDVDEETQKPVRGTGRSATTKDKQKESRGNRESRSRKKSETEVARSERPIVKNLESPPLPRSYTDDFEERNVTVERRKSSGAGRRKSSSRPPSTQDRHPLSREGLLERTSKRDEAVYYGVGVPMYARAAPMLSQPIPLRARPLPTVTGTSSYVRPASYHAAYPPSYGARPPLSTSAYYQGHQAPPLPTPSYPPPAAPSYMNYAAPQADYFARPVSTQPARSLSERFTPVERSASAFGERPLLGPRPAYDVYGYENGEYESEEEYDSPVENPRQAVRRASMRPSSIRPPPPRKTKEQEDYELMPPPPRPKPILRRKSVHSVDMPGSFPSESPRASPIPRTSPVRRASPPPRESRSAYREESIHPRRQRPKRSSVSYNLDREEARYQLQPAISGRPRRQSYYGQSASTESSGGYEDKVRQASMYQDDVTGGSGIALTAELLKRQQRRQAGSSRSTKSSGSHDDSDFRRSATTRTTRSGSGADDGSNNVTIKVLGSAKLLVEGTQIECVDGGEFQIPRRNSLRNGSERSSYSEYGPAKLEDRHSQRSGQSSRYSYQLENPMENFI